MNFISFICFLQLMICGSVCTADGQDTPDNGELVAQEIRLVPGTDPTLEVSFRFKPPGPLLKINCISNFELYFLSLNGHGIRNANVRVPMIPPVDGWLLTTVDQMALDSKYDVRVKATSCSGERMDEVAQLSVDTPSCLETRSDAWISCLPSPVQNFRSDVVQESTSPCSSSIVLKWSPPKDFGAWPNLVYEVSWERKHALEGGLPQNNVVVNITKGKWDLRYMKPGTYFVAVSARGPAGPGSQQSAYVTVPECGPKTASSTLPTLPSVKVLAQAVGPDNSANVVVYGLAALFIVIVIMGVGLVVLWKRYSRGRSKKSPSQNGFIVSLTGKDNMTYLLSDSQLQFHKGYEHLGANVHYTIDVLKVIGDGTFGAVTHCLLTIQGRKEPLQVAVKTVKDKLSEEEEKALRGETEILRRLPLHKNVVGMIGHIQDGGSHRLILEYCAKGDLRAYLQRLKTTPRNSGPAAVRRLIMFAQDIAGGMTHLARHNIIHRDLALRNCLLTGDDVVKISDFGLSRVGEICEAGIYRQLSPGRVPWKLLAPEALDMTQNIYSTKSDVWAFGILLYEIFTLGDNPFPNLTGKELGDQQKLLTRMLDSSRPFMDKPVLCPDAVYRIMLKCWNRTRELRPEFFVLARELECLLDTQSAYLKVLAGDENYAYFHVNRQ